MAQRPGWRHGAFHSLSWGLKGAYLCFWYPAQRRSPLPALPADHPAAESSLCISQAADATWGKCVKPVTPRALRKTGYKTKAFLSLRECLQMRWMPECVRACQLENKSSTWTSAQKADSPARHLLSSEETPSLALRGHKVLSGGWWEPDFSTSFSPPACRADKSCGLAAQAVAQRDLQRFDTAQTFPRHQPTYSSPRVKKNSTEIKNHKCNCLNSHSRKL